MIPEYRRLARRHALDVIRLLLIVPGSHPWNALVRNVTARLKGHASYDDEVTDG